MNPLKQLSRLGQSPWYDNIKRSLLLDGGLKRMIDEDGILGVTSNPTIFEKAINSSTEYDDDIQKHIEFGKSAKEIYDELTIYDISMAADILLDTFKKSNGVDGYVSIEVLPEYAHNASKTIEYAENIFRRINRENIMIKVPGTKESPEAIQALIRDGINVNVTLLFSLLHYEAIADAYIRGLKDRLKKGGDVSKVSSVASVFVSRVDTRIDKMLEEKAAKELVGKAAVANIKMIYQRFCEIFDDENFGQLRAKGARHQRVLWASTGTKNPAYSDVKYVQELIARNSINTIPDATLAAFKDHGKPAITIEDGIEEAKEVLVELAALGIDINKVCQDIQDDGVDSFQASFDKLVNSITQKQVTISAKKE